MSKRGVSPSSIINPPLLIKERDTRGESKRGEASLIYPFPLPLGKGRGIKGEGLLSISSLRT
jgi:hypothetical protein